MKSFIPKLIAGLIVVGSIAAYGIAIAAPGPNLIQNANLNEVDPANSKIPRYWLTGKWGTNTAVFTYPATSTTDATNGAKLAVTSYTSGDAKWYFQPVSVTPNTSYRFTASYTSTAAAQAVVQYTSTTNVVSYVSLGAVPASAGYSTVDKTFTTPANVAKATVFILLDKVGTYTVDNYFLGTATDGSTPPPPPQQQGGNLILNPSVETANPTNAGLPDKWLTGKWGTNTTTFTYPAPGFTGARGASVNMTSHTGGDAKWYFNDVDVTPGAQYVFSEQYSSTAQTYLTIRYTSTTGVVSYVGLGNLPASTDWKSATWTFTAPSSAKSLTIFHLIDRVGTLSVDDYSLTTVGGTTTPPITDTQKPAVSFAKPSSGSTASGTVAVQINAADNVGVQSVRLAIDGSFIATASTSPYTFNIDTSLYSNAPHILTAEARDLAGNIATTSISITVSNTVVDTVAPAVTIASPGADSTISGTTTIAVNATDNVGVSMVHIAIDTQDAAILSASPYIAVINTSTFNNGVHTISAYAVDAAGNIGNATPVTVTINNTPSVPEAANLISNASLEIQDSTNSAKPADWDNGFWGANDAAFSYPITGIDGTRAARVTITSHTDGDAKWFFKDVPVTVGGSYVFSEKYKSNVSTVLTARFAYADNTFQYRDIVTLPAVSDWTSTETVVTIPDNAVSMTLFHLINRVGVLDIDAYSLTAAGTSTPVDPNQFTEGMVSLTFDDGWTSQYINALPILQAAGFKAGFYMITDEMDNASIANNRIDNPDFEVAAGTTPDRPVQWAANMFGSHNAVFGYPVTGMNGSKAVEIGITSYTSGAAQWIPTEVTVVDGYSYSYQTDYKSTIPTTLVIQYTYNDNSTELATIETVPAALNWTHYEKIIKMPTNLKSVTIFQSLRGVGTLTQDNTYLYQEHTYMDKTKVKNLFDLGHEVSSHTLTHPHLTTLSPADAAKEINDSRADLLSMGITPVDTFIYPYGDYNDAVKQLVASAGYKGARSVDRGFNLRNTDKLVLQIQQVDQTTTQSQFQTWVDSAKNNKTWLILMYHQIEEGNSDPLAITPGLLQTMVNYLKTQNIPVVTMDQALAQMLP